MIDIRWTELTLGLSLLFNISFFLYVIVNFRRSVVSPLWQNTRPNKWLLLFSFLLIIFVSPGSSSDWYSYQDLVWNYDLTPGATNHGEPIYRHIVSLVNQNYLLFRIIVWGGAFLLSCMVFNRMGININVAVYFLISVFLLRFNYARATLAMASYFQGLSLLLKPNKNRRVLSFLLAALFLWGAYEFHISMLPVLLLTIVAFLPLDKPYVLIPLLVFLPILATYISNHFYFIDLLEDETIVNSFNRYSEREGVTSNIMGIIANIIMYGAFVIPIIVTTLIVASFNKQIDVYIKRLYRVTISIALFASSFLFMEFQSLIFVYRFLFMTFIPITVICVYLYQNRMMSKPVFSFVVLWGVLSNMQPLFTGLYHLIR